MEASFTLMLTQLNTQQTTAFVHSCEHVGRVIVIKKMVTAEAERDNVPCCAALLW